MNSFLNKTRVKGLGFTLLELMVVMAIFGIMATIGVYSYIIYIPRHQQLSAARIVINDLVRARIRAIKTRKAQQFNLFINRYTISDDSTTFLVRDFSNDYHWDNVRVITPREPTFNTNGTINNISTITIMCGDNEPVAITMTITGNIRISS